MSPVCFEPKWSPNRVFKWSPNRVFKWSPNRVFKWSPNRVFKWSPNRVFKWVIYINLLQFPIFNIRSPLFPFSPHFYLSNHQIACSFVLLICYLFFVSIVHITMYIIFIFRLRSLSPGVYLSSMGAVTDQTVPNKTWRWRWWRWT